MDKISGVIIVILTNIDTNEIQLKSVTRSVRDYVDTSWHKRTLMNLYASKVS